MKLFKRILFSVAIFLLLVAGALFVIANVYEKKVKDYMIGQLNSNLKTKVIVDTKNIQFSLFKNFPYASLSFKNVTMLEAARTEAGIRLNKSGTDKKYNNKNLKQDTLFSVDNISFQFNILDIISKKFIVKKISADNGEMKLKLRADGSRNWDVWKGNSDTTSSSSESAFKIEKFKLENIFINYLDLKKRNNISCVVRTGVAGGEFTNKKYDLSINSDLFVNYFNIDSANYLDGKSVKLALNLKVDNDRNQYEFNDAQLSISDFKIVVEGKYISNKISDYIDVFLKGKDMDVQSVLSLLPEKYHKEINDYESDGILLVS